MSVTNALWVNGISVRDARMNTGAFVAKNGANPLDVRLGVLYAGTTSLITGTATTSPSMTVSVERFHYVGRKASADGPYIGTHDTVETVNIAAAPATGSRIDVVYIMQRDADAPTAPDGTTVGELGVVTGTAATTPTKPVLPTGAVEVGTVTVAAGATKTTDGTVTIATTALWTTGHGAPVPVRNTTERGALSPYVGMTVTRLDKGGLVQFWDGSSWRGARRHANRVSVTSDGSGYATITHGAGFLPVAVLASNTGGYQMGVDSYTSTTFRVRLLQADGSVYSGLTTEVSYEAVEALS